MSEITPVCPKEAYSREPAATNETSEEQDNSSAFIEFGKAI